MASAIEGSGVREQGDRKHGRSQVTLMAAWTHNGMIMITIQWLSENILHLMDPQV